MNRKHFMKSFSAVCAAVISFSSLPVYMSGADFVKENGKVYYYDEDGTKERGLVEIDGDTYYFDSKGVMQTGWITLKKRYKAYFRTDGTMVKGSARIKGKSYYFDEDTGYMQTGNIIVEDTIRQYSTSGVYIKTYKNELVKIGKKLYYADKKGNVSYGMQKVGGTYYYFGDSGFSISTEIEEGDYLYTFDKDEGLIGKDKIFTADTVKEPAPEPSPAPAKKDAIQPVSVTAYPDSGTGFESFVAKNEKNGVFSWKGVLKNYSCFNGCRVTVEMLCYDKNNVLIKKIEIVSSEKLRNIGDRVEFDGTWVTDVPVAKVKFDVTRVNL